jgi:hypothetical protein
MRTLLVLITLLAAAGCSKTIHEAHTDVAPPMAALPGAR